MKNGAWTTQVIIQRGDQPAIRYMVITSLVENPIVDKLTIMTTISDEKGDMSTAGKLHDLRVFVDNKIVDIYEDANKSNRSITIEEAWEVHTVAVLNLYEMNDND